MSISDQLSVNGNQYDDPTPTQKVYRPIARLDAEHRAAFSELQAAVMHGDEEAMKLAFDKIMVIEAEQVIAHRAVREYALQKASHTGMNFK